jgi:hypothetical protein
MPIIASSVTSTSPDIAMSPTTTSLAQPIDITTTIQNNGNFFLEESNNAMELGNNEAQSQAKMLMFYEDKNDMFIQQQVIPNTANVKNLPSTTTTNIAAHDVLSSSPATKGGILKNKQVTPPQQNSSPTSTSSGRGNAKQGGNTMKCIVCNRGRKINLAKSDKFCSSRCLNMWVESNPGMNVDEAEATSCDFPMPPTTTVDRKVPRVIKNLLIDMALPGNSPSSVSSSITPTSSKRSHPDSQPQTSKKFKEQSSSVATSKGVTTATSTAATIPIPAPVSTATPASKKKEFPADVTKWNVDDVYQFFNSKTECKNVAPLLQEQEVDGQALLYLTHDTLVKCLGLKLGPALKVMIYVKELRQQQANQMII